MNLRRTKTSKIRYDKSQNKAPSAFEKLLENSQKSVNILKGIIKKKDDQKNNFTYKIIKNCLDNNNHHKNYFLNDSSQKHLASINENDSFNSKNNSKNSSKIVQRDKELKNSILKFESLINNNDDSNNENDSKNIELNKNKKILSPKLLSKNKTEYFKKFNLDVSGSPKKSDKNKRKSGFSVYSYKNYQSKYSMNKSDENQELALNNNENKRVRGFFSFLKKNNENDRKNSRKDSILSTNSINYISMKEYYVEYPKLKKFLHKLKIIYFLCCIFAILSFLFACIDNEIYNIRSWEFLEKKYYLNNYNKTKVFNKTIIIDIKNRKISSRENFIRSLNGICSCVDCILLIIMFKYKLIQMQKNKNIEDRENEIMKNHTRLNNKSLFDLRIKEDKKRFLFLKLFLAIIFYPPGVNFIIIRKSIFFEKINIYAYSLNSIFVLINFSKLTIIILYILEFSRYNSIITKKYCHNKFKINSEFRAKSIFQRLPLISCFITSTIIVLILGISVRFLDAFSYSIQYESEDIYSVKSVNEFFFALAIQSHHWFGNYKPITFLSKIIIYVGGTFGMIILSIWSFYFNLSMMELNPEENKVYTKLLKLRNFENTAHKTTNLIKEFLNLRKLYINFNNLEDNGSIEDYLINYKMFLKEKFIIVMKFRLELSYFKDERKIARNYSLPIGDILDSLEKKMDENIDSCNNQINKLYEVRSAFTNFKYNDQIITQTVNEVRKQNAVIYEYLKQYYNECNLNFTTIIKPQLLKKPIKHVFFKERRSSACKIDFKLKRHQSKKHSKINNEKSEKFDSSFVNNYLKRKVFSSTISKKPTLEVK